MSRRLVVSVIVCSVLAGIVIGYVRGLPNDFVESPDFSIDYGYRCGDGSEFTLVPHENMSTLLLLPATSADYLTQTLLERIAGDTYAAEGIMFVADDLTAELTTKEHGTTVCTSMNAPKDTLFHH